MNTHLPKVEESEYSRLLSAIFEFMLAGGLSGDAIASISNSALKKATEKSRKRRAGSPGKLATTASILDAWHRDRRYLNSKASPRAVRLLGRAPSVEALVRAEDFNEPPIAFARQMRNLGFVVPDGKGLYRPASNIALISSFDPMLLQHVAHSLTTLLETIGHNLAHHRESERLVERFAEVPDLPASDVASFCRFSQVQSWILLQTTNDWLESRRAKRTTRLSRKVVQAGLHVHAYVSSSKKHAPLKATLGTTPS